MTTPLLLIDDELIACDFVKSALPAGYELTYAPSLDEGKAMATARSYDVILVDLQMPFVENGDALNTMLEVSPSSVVMVLTKLHSTGYAVSLIRQGAAWVAFKPDSGIEIEIAERYLMETILFTKAAHDRQQGELLRASVNAASVEELRRTLREMVADRQQMAITLAVMEQQRQEQAEDIERLYQKLEAQAALVSVYRAEREKGKWGLLKTALAAVGAALTVILPWLAHRLGWKLPP